MDKYKISYYTKTRSAALKEVILKFSFGYKMVDNLTGNSKYKPFIYDTGVKTKLSDWDTEQSVPSKTKDFVAAERVKEKLEILYKHLVNEGQEINPDILREKMDILLGRKKKSKSITGIYAFIYEYILENEEKKDRKKFQYSYNTRRNYRSLNKLILEYEKENHVILTAESLDKEQYLDFQKKSQEKSKKNNTAWSQMKNLTAALRKIGKKYKIKVFDPTDELEHKEKISQKTEDKIYFEFFEIQRIIDFKPPNKKLRNIKLILLTLIFSGVRYSDIHKVLPKYKYESTSVNFRYAHFITAKNPTEVIVPFVKPLEDALLENNGKSASRIPQMEFNEDVKILCKMVGFTDMRKLVFTNTQGEKEFEEKAHFRFVSSHIGRRSFITNFINVIPPTLITKITGHQFKMKDVVFKYNKIKPLKGAVLFMKFVKKLSNDEDWQDEFPIQLIQ